MSARTLAAHSIWRINADAPARNRHAERSRQDAIRSAATPASHERPAFERTPEEAPVPILGVICDVTRVADPMEAAMALSECSRLPAARRGTINWLGDLAAAFPSAIIEYTGAENHVYTGRNGNIDWNGKRSIVTAAIAGDLRRGERASRELPAVYLAFASCRSASASSQRCARAGIYEKTSVRLSA